MTSVTKRKQLVNELRKAHFPFGFEQNNKPSEYNQKYPQYAITGATQKTGDARKNNFSIGNPNDVDGNAYQSEFKNRFTDFEVKEKPEPIGQKNTENKNVIFGYDNPADGAYYKSNYKDDFNKKANQTNDRNQPIDQRKRNIEFGDSLTDFTTTYGKVFDQKSVQGNKAEIDKPLGRQSHLMFGNDKNNFQTQNSAAFRNLPGEKYQFHKQANSSNIDLGSGNTNYASENRQNFFNKEPNTEVFDKEKIKDFRSAHFQFGFPEQSGQGPQSESKAQYGAKPIEVLHGESKRQSNINLNVDGNTYYESSYGKQYENWGPIEKAQINKNGRKDNVLIGVDDDQTKRYISEAKQNFDSKQISRVQPIRAEGGLVLGEVENDFKTHHQMTYDNKFPRHEGKVLTQEEIQKMKKISIVTGFQGENYDLHSKEYGKKFGDRGRLPKETLDKMKNTNIVMETVPVDFGSSTSYKASYPNKRNDQY